MRVDLPAPFWPSSACTSPGNRSKLTSRSAFTAPKLFEMLRNSSSGVSTLLPVCGWAKVIAPSLFSQFATRTQRSDLPDSRMASAIAETRQPSSKLGEGCLPVMMAVKKS